MEKTFWVYILKCSDDSYYTGSTSNLERRLSEHQQGTSKGYTTSRRPVKLVFSQFFSDPYEAFSAERQIKRWTRAKKQALMDGKFELLHDLAKCKNETNSNNRKTNKT